MWVFIGKVSGGLNVVLLIVSIDCIDRNFGIVFIFTIKTGIISYLTSAIIGKICFIAILLVKNNLNVNSFKTMRINLFIIF